jgi:hypothetical protein
MGWVILGMVVTGLLSGCATWYETPSASQSSGLSTSGLPAAKSSPDTIDIETIVVRFSEDRLTELETIWKTADESVFEFESRQALDVNGLRAGLFRGELPDLIQEQLSSAASQQSGVMELAGLSSDADSRMRLMRCRAGRRKEIVIRRDVSRPLSIVTSTDGQLSGQTFYDRPVALFALTPFPTMDGKATLELIPEVHYGEAVNRFVTSDAGVRQELRRSSKGWKELKVRAQLSTGEVMVIAATHPPKALGAAFFVADTVQHTEEHLVLLVRLAATQLDDLFGEDQIATARAMMEQR